MSNLMLPENEAGWKADLQLEFSRPTEHNRPTVLSKKQFLGPMTVQKPFYPEDDVCHVYLLHPPGGIVGGDKLHINLRLHPSAHSLVTTPAATKYYRSGQHTASIEQHFRIEENACLEWLPQENIFFDASHAKIRTRVDLHPDAKLIAWDIICLGRPAAKEKYHSGIINQRFELFVQQQRCLTDHMMIRGGSESLNAAWGLRGFPVIGYMLLYPGKERLLDSILEKIRPLAGIETQQILSISLLNNIIVCRYLGYHGEQARQKLTQIWELARPIMLQKTLHIPRIWLT